MNFVDTVLREHLGAEELGRHGIGRKWASVLLTPQFVTSRHVVALIFPVGSPRPALVVKVPRRPGDNKGVQREADMLRRLEGEGVAGIPKVVTVFNVGAHTVLVETALTGSPLDPELVVEDFTQAVRAGEEFIAGLPCTIPAAENTDWYERTIGRPLRRMTGLLPGDAELALLVERTHAQLAPLAGDALPAVFEHGDLSHPNLFLQPDGSLQVVDWERSSPDGLPGLDLVFYLQYLGESLAGAYTRQNQLTAFDEAFGTGGWALDSLRRHLHARDLNVDLLPSLILATWARSAATLAYRLAGEDDPRQGEESLRAAIAGDRDFWLWRHLVRTGQR
ncbi:aminoglycoside phosphotransferase family protein [Arthrobacter frigidicola]|nr:aminoglycoside phosphotransferase family protein [Arthrobacter frigidicola]